MNIRVKLTKRVNAQAQGESVGAVVSLEFESYLKGVVGTEAYPTWDADALRAQAIACRSYALYHAQNRQSKDYDVTDNTNFQSYLQTKVTTSSTAAAVQDTAGLVLVHNNKVIMSEYASSNGCMSDAAGKPYYRSGYDAYTYRSGRRTKFGHQRGMSQWGMQQAAKEGLSYQNILTFYYPNTSLVSNYNGAGSSVTPGVSTQPIANKGAQIVALARAQIGKPYVMGSSGPSQFDCSGLVKYCYSAFGISLPHGSTSIHKQTQGSTVWTPANPSNAWAAGDLVFIANKSSTVEGATWSPTNYTTHIGIATGTGKMVVEAKGTNYGVVESDWRSKTTLHSVTRIFDPSETGVMNPGFLDGGATGIIPGTLPPIVNISDIISGIVDPYKELIDSIVNAHDNAGYMEIDKISNNALYGYLIDIRSGSEFKFLLPDYSISLSSNYESINIPGRSSPVKSYESTSEKSLTIKVTLAAGTGVYGNADNSSDPIDLIDRDVRFVKSLLYPDYSKSLLMPPATVVLILGNNDRFRGIITSVDTDYQRPFDNRGRYMIVELSFTLVEVLPYPEDYSDVRVKKFSPTFTTTGAPASTTPAVTEEVNG